MSARPLTPAAGTITRSAVLSPCGLYRYTLERRWADGGNRCCFVMLNPSKADDKRDDPTVKRCIAFAQRWGYDSLLVLNVHAFIATKPKYLYRAKDPVGPENAEYVLNGARASARVVCAWGANKLACPEARVLVAKLKRQLPGALECLATVASGAPQHPLFVRGDTVPRLWS